MAEGAEELKSCLKNNYFESLFFVTPLLNASFSFGTLMSYIGVSQNKPVNNLMQCKLLKVYILGPITTKLGTLIRLHQIKNYNEKITNSLRKCKELPVSLNVKIKGEEPA